MIKLQANGINGILADEMGLGMTVFFFMFELLIFPKCSLSCNYNSSMALPQEKHYKAFPFLHTCASSAILMDRTL